ncbi:hypothetical protein V6N13_121107 [Hibiscus sabdariffa]
MAIIGSESAEFYYLPKGHGNLIGSEPSGIYERLSVHLESNRLCAESESANILPSKRGEYCNIQFFDKFVQHFNESIAIDNNSAVDSTGLFQLQQFEFGNLLSENPMVTNYDFLNRSGDSKVLCQKASFWDLRIPIL